MTSNQCQTDCGIGNTFNILLTVHDHFACHEVLVGEGGHKALVLPRQLGGGVGDEQCPVLGRRMITRSSITKLLPK